MMTQAAILLPAIAVSLMLLLTAIGVRRPVIARLALRNSLRRPAESALAAAGIALGVGLLIGALVTGDSVSASVEGLGPARLDPVDVEIVVAGQDAYGRASRLQEAISATVSASLLRRSAGATVGVGAREGGGLARAEPSASLYDLDFERADAFASTSGSGLPAAGPARGEVYVSASLADELDLHVGETFYVSIGGKLEPYKVAAVLPLHGLAGFSGAFDRKPLSVWLPTGTLAGERANAELLIDLPGGHENPDAVADAFISGAAPALGAVGEPKATAIKARSELVALTTATSRAMRSQLLALGIFAMLAALILIAAIMAMTMWDRRREIGVLRAVGAGQINVGASAGQESIGLSIVGSVGGAIVGAAVAVLTVTLTGRALERLLPGVEMHLSWQRGSLLAGFGAGMIAGILAGMASTRRWSAMSPARAFGDLGETSPPLRLPTLVGGACLLAFGMAVSITDLRAANPLFSYLGPPIAILGGILLLWQTRWAYLATLVGGLAAAGWIVGIDLHMKGKLATSGLPVLIGSGLVLVAGLSGAFGVLSPLLARGLVVAGEALRIRSVPARLAAAQSGSSRAQAGFIAAVCGLVVLMPVAVSGSQAMERSDVDRQVFAASGGWEIRTEIKTSASGEPDAATRLLSSSFADKFDLVTELPTVRSRVNLVGAGDTTAMLYGTGRELGLAANRPGGNGTGAMLPLVARDSPYGSDAEAWESLYQAQADGFPRAIVTLGSMPRGVELRGGYLRIGNSDRLFKIAGIASPNEFIPGVFAEKKALESVGLRFDYSNALAVPRRGVDIEALILEMQGAFAADGCKAISATDVVNRRFGVRSVVSEILRAFFSIGLLVGAGAVGVVMARSVRARRRQIAVLRALGERRLPAAVAIVLESLMLTTVGVAIGTLAGGYIGRRVFVAATIGGEAPMPWAVLIVTGLVALLIISVGAVIPSVSAARKSPAESLRS